MRNCAPKTIRFFESGYRRFEKSFKGEEIIRQALSEFVTKMRESGLSLITGMTATQDAVVRRGVV